MLKINNTLTKQIEEFKPINKDKVLFYHCGPTVYWVQHIGNMRAMTMADLIRRSLIYLGYEVDFVRNYTDVGHLTSDEDEGEDKMEKGAKREGSTPEEIAEKYITIFDNDLKALNHLELDPKFKPKATEYVEQIINLVQKLIKNDFAYSTSKAIYFNVPKKTDYNKLNKQKLEFNRIGAGTGDVSDPDKKHPQDFALWLFKTGSHKNAIQTWESPFESSEVENGEGFPGWHIECSAMSISLLGETLDIHMGGIEHIPVHHTNEIAQSESATGKEFANYWIHNEHLNVDGGKMSKSEGTSYALKDIIEKGYDPLILRYFFLNSQYRSKQNFTWEALDAAKTGYDRLVARVSKLGVGSSENGESVDEEANEKFISTLEDDFNIPGALATTWDMLKSDIDDKTKLNTVLKFDEVLGLNLSNVGANIVRPNEEPPEIQAILDERQKARDEKDWAKADELRDKLKDEFGLKVIDGDSGQEVEKV